ncbi:CNBP [Mytilus coruscus]|uniref:CNBP n=1 Tax=Mytilus coruscus TaxID=42192 RepID=A0A6J8DUI6_MYTCO|nr:CNBP [Mytilus coruscus]
MASELDTVHHNNQQIHRYTSVHFSSKYIKEVTHTDILNELEKYIKREKVKAIQLTERECVVTVDDQDSKILLLIKGIELKNYHYKFGNVEKEVTQVTIKDAPVEFSDHAVCTFMRQYGEVVQDSLLRGTIRGTNIETGTRYIQLINCVSTIPNITKLGRFEIRLFADNNRTQCRYCSRTDHPAYRCDMKPQRQERQRYCFRCSSHDHIIRDCRHTDNICFECGQESHIKRDCDRNRQNVGKKEQNDQITDENEYGDYIHKFRKGRETTKQDQIEELNVFNDNHTTQQHSVNIQSVLENNENNCLPLPPNTIILGASNCCRLKISDRRIHNASVSGSTAEDIDKLLVTLDKNVDKNCVSKVIFGLGGCNREAGEQLLHNVTKTLSEGEKRLCDSEITKDEIFKAIKLMKKDKFTRGRWHNFRILSGVLLFDTE